jgi:predicted DNA repair protein MutK
LNAPLGPYLATVGDAKLIRACHTEEEQEEEEEDEEENPEEKKEAELLDAAVEGDIMTVETLLMAGVSVNCYGEVRVCVCVCVCVCVMYVLIVHANTCLFVCTYKRIDCLLQHACAYACATCRVLRL